MKRKKTTGRAKAAIMQPRFRTRLTPAKKGAKSYRRRPKHPRPETEQD